MKKICQIHCFSTLKILTAFIGCLSFLASDVHAQLLDSDQPRPGIDWQQIETRHFRIIFPAEIASEGQRVANTVEYLYFPLRKTLTPNSCRWPLVLSNRSAEANGYVTLAPRKSEWFTTPTQSSMAGSIEWYNLLAIHEGRHMVQFDRFNSGFTRLAGLLAGEYAVLGLTVWHTPMWFFEGDAVGIETALSSAGRGRQPEFDLAIRTLLLNNQLYSYDKAYLGSYKDYYPDYYHLGFLMTTHGRRSYGANFWDRAAHISTRRSWNPFGFSKASRILTGRNTKGLYTDTMTELDSLWRTQLEGLEFTSAQKINLTPKKVWTQYRWPQYTPDGSVVAVIYGLADTHTLIRLNPDGSQSELAKINGDNRISVAGDLIAWDELNPDPRWGAEVFSDIYLFDRKSGKARQITSEGKYFSPAISPDGSALAVVKFTPERRCHLVLMDPATGAELRALSNPDNGFIKNPAWSPDGRRLVYFKQGSTGKSLALYDLENDAEEIITAECHPFDEFPEFFDRFILYNSAWSGIDNIYAVEIPSGRRFQVTSRKFGAYYPSVSADGTRLLFSDYDVNGLDVCEMPFDPQNWQPLETVERRDIRYYEPLVQQEQGGNLFVTDKIPQKRFAVTDYHPLKHLMNIHSWYYLISSTSADIGLYSNDILNTAAVNTKVSFNSTEKVFSLGSEICYAGFYPILSAGVNLGKRASYFGEISDDLTTGTSNETAFSLGADLPLDFSEGATNRILQMSLSGAYTHVTEILSIVPDESRHGCLLPFSYGIAYKNYQTPAPRDVKPIAGYTTQINFRHTPLKGDYKSRIISLQGNYYLPGFAKHHSLMLDAKLEWQDPVNYRFASLVSYAKSYDYLYHDLFTGAGATYEMPLAYPDLAFGSLIYFKRLRGALFGDFNFGKTGAFRQQYNSVGVDLNFDFCVFDLYAELYAGVRIAYRFADQSHQVSPLILGIEF